MFKQYPYRGWLILAIALWALAIGRYYQKSIALQPTNMAAIVERDLQQKEYSFSELVSDKELVSRMFSGSLAPGDVKKLTSLPYGLYAYKNDTIVFWNNNKVLADCEPPALLDEATLFRNERGKFLKECIIPDSANMHRKLVVLYPIVTTYPFENSYLSSSFAAAGHIPVSTNISSRKVEHSYVVKNSEGHIAFYLQFDKTALPAWTPGNPLLIILIGAVFMTVFWLQLITIHFTRKRSFWYGFFILFGVIITTRVLLYRFGEPFNLEELTLFSPQLYATSVLLPSLGDLLINSLLLLWLVSFIVRYGPVDFLAEAKLTLPVRVILALIMTVLLIAYSFAFINVISTLVTDSNISFDVSHFYTISSYSIIGLFIVSIVTAASFIVVYLFSRQLKVLIPNKCVKYLVLATAGVIMIVLSDTVTSEYVSYILLSWLLLFIILLDVPKLSLSGDLFSPRMIFWAAFICAFCTAVLQYFNYVKEREARKRFAEEVVRQRDDITEFTFRNISDDIRNDPILITFFKAPGKTQRKDVDERFDALYLSGHLNKYQAKLLLFDKQGRALYNNDTLSYRTLKQMVRNSMPTFTPYLYYRENALDGHYYIAEVPVGADTSAKKQLGYVYIDMAVKESAGQTVYPELLQPGTVRGNRNAEGYSYGVYVNDRLITQTSDYNFPLYFTDTIKGQYRFIDVAGQSELQMKIDDDKTVIVIRYHRLWLETITLFSYLFGIQMLVSLLTLLYHVYLKYFFRKNEAEKLINFTLRRRIHISFLGIVFVSFIIIGVITIVFFTLQYKQNNSRKQQLIMQLVERATLQFLKEKDATENLDAYNREVATTAFRYFITGLSNAQKIDINIYHASGVLNVTSQEDIYDRSLFARIIAPSAYYTLYNNGSQFLIQEEQIGQLTYVSCYKPLVNKEGVILGFINVPFFSSEKELNFQISSILVGLINLYAFVFLFSGVLTVFITQWITKSFNVVIKSFSRFSLSKNEPVSWPYDDEIGLLVNEYNKMVKKAEENARLLAQSEREGAWREMAQQVAHEIKNPLTPMKLNIQYLQQALENKYPNVNELAKKVSDSLIEQINNLSYIASEFSNFAKMPEARPEKFDLNILLQKTVDLYKNQTELNVVFRPYKEPMWVYTDKSQLLRVCNNLLENAVQAIPPDKEGEVTVSLGREGDDALIAFKDNGTGIDAEAVGKIFQPYFTTKSSGTGLGLAMTKKIIEFWRGTIRFETTPGKGTTFYITIPLANGEEL